MILSGARGKLVSVDAKSKTVRILRRAVEEDYECEGDVNLGTLRPLVGKRVDLELRDFLVIGVTQRADD
jgi:hypothetical protein